MENNNMNKLTRMIGFTGLAGSGKSYAANWMRLRTGETAVFSFANLIKTMAINMGWDGEKDVRGRKLLQDIGTAGREYRRDCWVRHLPDYPVIVDDVRYINEAAAIRAAGGIIVRVVRPGLTPMNHSSETEQADIVADYTITSGNHIEEELEVIYEALQRNTTTPT